MWAVVPGEVAVPRMGGHATASPRDDAAATGKGRGGVVVRWVVSPG